MCNASSPGEDFNDEMLIVEKYIIWFDVLFVKQDGVAQEGRSAVMNLTGVNI